MTAPQAILAVILLSVINFSVRAEPNGSSTLSLPEPLTLDYALSLAEEMTPAIQKYQADVFAAEAALKQAESLNGFNAYLEARARWIEPADSVRQFGDEDHRLGLIANKTLYDFGYSASAENAASFNLSASRLQMADARQQQRILIMQRYFAVVLADLQFYRYNEEMAVVFISMDRTKDRRELGQASDLDVLKAEAEYQRIRHLRYKSQNEQRMTRARLAQALNRHGKLPSTVSIPEVKVLKRKLAEVEVYQKTALEKNSLLKAIRLKLDSASESVNQARASNNPRLIGELGAFEYERELGSSDKWRAGVVLEFPLWTGGSSDAKLASAQADLYRQRARLRELEIKIDQAILETWLELDALRIRLQEMETVADYRELYLDRSRALYEMEVKTDLGDSMVKVSEAQRNLKKVQFDIALAWAKLEALVGQNLDRLYPKVQSETSP